MPSQNTRHPNAGGTLADPRSTIMTLLKRHRLAQGLSQQEVAQRTGCSIAAYSSWETGRSMPKAKRVKKLARVLSIPPMELTHVLVPEKGESVREENSKNKID
jgi:transcriptional regulator with XRE-family HTH domain